MLQAPKNQVLIILFSTLLAGFSLASIINFTDPSSSSWVIFAFFYISLFLTSLGIFTIIGLYLREWTVGGLYAGNLGNSFRQGIFVSLLIIISLVLKSRGLLFWWMEASLILFLVFLEAFLNLKV